MHYPLGLLLQMTLLSALGAQNLNEQFEEQPFTEGEPAGSWVRGSRVFWDSYTDGGGILNRAASDLGERMISLNPVSGFSWIYRDTGIEFEPNTTYTLHFHAGSRQNSAYQGGGVLEFGFWDHVPAQPFSELPLAPDDAGGERVDTSVFPEQTMVAVDSYSFITGADVSGMGSLVVFVRNLESGNGRSSVDSLSVEVDSSLPDRPNILWLVAEDMSPTLGCYGDPNATTPRIDSFASEALRYDRCWCNAPFCSPARTTLISGTYATRNGGFSHRSSDPLVAPDFLRFYPRILQEYGYYTSNNSKEDYNIVHRAGQEWRKGWNESSGTAHWRNRPAGQPFFSIFNLDDTHESRIRPVGGGYPVNRIHNSEAMILPDCHPDIPKLRESWASHHDYITLMDSQMGAILDELEADGLEEDTIVFFYSDHGSCIPGYKRFVGNRGQHLPLLVHFPPKYQHLAPPGYLEGGATSELVSFVDFAPTLLSLLDVEAPDWMQGRAFFGERREPEPEHLFGFVCRHDRIANTRSVTDGRYVYIRNFQVDTPHGAWVQYTYGNQATNPPYATLGAGEWFEEWLSGGLSPVESHFFENQGPEQLYDLENDPDETVNLVANPDFSGVLLSLRSSLDGWMDVERDGGLLTEGRLYDLVASSGLSPWEVIESDSLYPYAEVLDTARRASSLNSDAQSVLAGRLSHSDATVRLWAARGLGYHGRTAVRNHEAALLSAANDSDYWVRVSARQTLALHASEPTRTASVDALFGFCNRWGIVSGGVTDKSAEREIHFAGDAISHLPYLDLSYRALTSSMNNETYETRNYRQYVFYWFYRDFHHPLAQFRDTHGLEKTGSNDFDNPSGDGASNLLRYAFNLSNSEGELLHPVSPIGMDPNGLTGLPILIHDSIDGELKYQFLRRRTSSDPRIGYASEHSIDLEEWEANSGVEEVETIDEEWERVKIPVADSSSGFFRSGISR